MHIVALGSSFASGHGIPPIVNKAAGRSGRNYAQQLAGQLPNARLTDLTASGSTLANILDDSQSTAMLSDATLSPQLSMMPSDADIVTITSGGNDLGYAMGMISDSALASTGRVGALLSPAKGPPVTAKQEEELTMNFVRIIDTVKQTAPNAKVYLVSYLPVFSEASSTSDECPLSKSDVQYYMAMAEHLAKATEQAAGLRPATNFVPIHQLCRGHEVGTAEPWITGFAYSMLLSDIAPYHPLEAGHTSIAGELFRRITSTDK